MKKKLPGILLLLAMPCCILIFVKVQELSGSDIVALLAAVLFYIAAILVCALVFNKSDPRNEKMEHPIIKEGESSESADAKEEK